MRVCSRVCMRVCVFAERSVRGCVCVFAGVFAVIRVRGCVRGWVCVFAVFACSQYLNCFCARCARCVRHGCCCCWNMRTADAHARRSMPTSAWATTGLTPGPGTVLTAGHTTGAAGTHQPNTASSIDKQNIPPPHTVTSPFNGLVITYLSVTPP